MGRLRRTHYRISLKEHGLSPDRPFRAAVLADLHDRAYRTNVHAVAEAILKEHCELVLSAGDLVVMKGGHFAYDSALALVGELAGKMPVYLANGNHETRMSRLRQEEYSLYTERLRELGAVLLINETAALSLHGVKLLLTGLELERAFFKGASENALNRQIICRKAGEPQEGGYRILLAHHPKFFEAYADWGADLTLSGHLHGGIARLPFLGGVISPDPALFPKYDHGLYRIGNHEMIVSAGLGTHTIHLRINNPAELVILDFC